MTVTALPTGYRPADLTAQEETARAHGACLACSDCVGCEGCDARPGEPCSPACLSWVEHEDRDPEADALCGITPAVVALLTLSAPRRLARVTRCRHCDDVIEREPAVGWVSARSGDEGGTYDVCDYAPNGTHRP